MSTDRLPQRSTHVNADAGTAREEDATYGRLNIGLRVRAMTWDSSLQAGKYRSVVRRRQVIASSAICECPFHLLIWVLAYYFATSTTMQARHSPMLKGVRPASCPLQAAQRKWMLRQDLDVGRVLPGFTSLCCDPRADQSREQTGPRYPGVARHDKGRTFG